MSAPDHRQLEALLLELQRERIALTCAIMALRGESATRRAKSVFAVIVALLRLQRANRRATAVLGAAERV